MAQTRIGISGWNYPAWRKNFYPEGLAQHRELEFASRQFNSIEINGSFYSLQTPQSYRKWHEQTPHDFVFAVKGGRFITHMKKLKDVEKPLANFFASGVLALREKLGPILWQLPPMLGFDPARMESFLKLLPKTTREAAALARQHDDRMEGRAFTDALVEMPLRHAFEVRHESYRSREFVELLRRYNAAFVFADTASRWPYFEDLTADFVYIRLHGASELYVSGYGPADLDGWANRIEAWREGKNPPDAQRIAAAAPKGKRDVYVYFDNDAKVHAPFDALALSRRLGAFEPALPDQVRKEPPPAPRRASTRRPPPPRWPTAARARKKSA